MRKRIEGFTLVELLFALGLLAVFAKILAPLASDALAAQDAQYVEKQNLTNKDVREALKAYTSKNAQGWLPNPYTGGGYTKTVFNPADVTTNGVALSQALTDQGVSPNEINDDGSAAANVRVYQMVPNLSYVSPLDGQSGSLVTLTYQFGAIYLARCAMSDSSCNPTSSTGVPGTSPALTAVNYASWKTTGTDTAAATVSSLPRQKAMLETTKARLDKLKDSLLDDFRTKQITAAAGDATNFFPSSSTSLSGQNPGSNQGCRDGWYSLATSDVLPNIQKSRTELGTTAWGGTIEFCRDYDPTGTKTPDAAPHRAALRIHSNVSFGLVPDPTVPGNNVVLTF